MTDTIEKLIEATQVAVDHAVTEEGSYLEKKLCRTLPAIKAMYEENKRLREANTWQPIETAPKDGTAILLLIPDVGWIEGWYFSNTKDDGWETCIGFIGEPTHWFSLPEPPHADTIKGAE